MRNIKAVTVVVPLLMLTVGCAGNGQFQKDKAEFAPMVRPVNPPAPTYNNGSLYQPHAMNLFEDERPHQIGDVLTVVLQESTNASKTASTTTSKDDAYSIEGPTLLGRPVTVNGVEILNNSLESQRAFKGAGDSSQSNSLDGNITVSVVEVLTNGNLVIQGEKWLTLNQGKEYVRIAGVVRPRDIRADNTVLSTRIADARIAYSGEGFVADSNSPGWLSRFFNSPYWPF